MSHWRTPLLPCLVLSVALSLGCEPAPDHPEGSPDHTSTGTAGLRAYIDPETGELGAPPTDQDVQPDSDQPLAARVESPELVEEPGPVSGVMIDPKGKFNRPLTAEVGPDGEVTVQHQAPSASQAVRPDGR